MHLIVISTVLPKPASGGEILLHRHFSQLPLGWSVEYHGATLARFGLWPLLRKIFGILGHLPTLRKISEAFFVFCQGRWLDGSLPPCSRSDAIVLTVAHGDACYAAARYAKHYNLPLVTIFHDWWPDMTSLPKSVRRFADNHFRRLAYHSNLCLCISSEMIRQLGQPPHAQLLQPIPEPASNVSPLCLSSPFTIRYLGNLHEYGSMLRQALIAGFAYQDIRLEVRGFKPAWPDAFIQEMAARGCYVPYAPRDQLHQWLANAHALLVTQSFDPAHRRRMETSFPSKLADYCAYSRPIIIWAPPWASSISWARSSQAADFVTDPNPAALMAAILKLAQDPQRQLELAQAAKKCAANEFNPQVIQEKFINSIKALRP